MASLLTDAERQAILEDIQAGELTRNDIARKHLRSPGTVTAIAQAHGLTFDRSATKEATAARLAQVDERLAQLALDLVGDAERLRQQLWEPCRLMPTGEQRMKVTDFEELLELPQPTPADKRNLVASMRMCVSTANDIRAKAKGGDEGRSMIERLVAGLELAVEAAA